MFGLPRWNSFDDVFSFQREVDRLFNQFWSDLPTRSAISQSPSFQVNGTEDGWRVDLSLPGIDPKDVSLEVAGNNLTIRAETPSEGRARTSRVTSRVDDSAVPRPRETDRLASTWDAAPDAAAEGKRQASPRPDRHAGGKPEATGGLGKSSAAAAGASLAADPSSDADVFAASSRQNRRAHTPGPSSIRGSRDFTSCHVQPTRHSAKAHDARTSAAEDEQR